jgi:hypothetical protein
MARRLAALSLSLALVTSGLLAAHTLAYRLVHGQVGHQHVHDYLARMPMVFALLFGLSIAALAVALRETELHLRAPAWLFALAPPSAFAVQEHLERAVQGLPAADTAVEPTFVLGLVLQAPFALLAYTLARTVFRAAEFVARLLAAQRPRRLRPARSARSTYELSSPHPAALARGFSSRGPPALSF